MTLKGELSLTQSFDNAASAWAHHQTRGSSDLDRIHDQFAPVTRDREAMQMGRSPPCYPVCDARGGRKPESIAPDPHAGIRIRESHIAISLELELTAHR